jgi:Zn-dependent peptidase ImmA (M78 family)
MPSRGKPEPHLQAERLLTRYQITDAPVPVEKIAKGEGAQVRFSPLDMELSGMVFIKDGTPIIGVNSLHHPNRQRFTIAHELGHLMMHREEITKEVHVDKDFPVLMRDTKAATGTDRLEIDANQFASALLMPKFLIESLLNSALSDIDSDLPVEEFAKKLRVSKQAVEYRIRNWF